MKILILIILLIVCIIHQYYKTESGLTLDHNPICINNDTYQKMLDIVTNYSLMANDKHKKIILIYLSTFHLFDMNYDIESIKILDNKLSNHTFVASDIEFPQGNMHYNLQKTIITYIIKYLDFQKLNNTKDHDKIIIDVFLINLFKNLNVLC